MGSLLAAFFAQVAIITYRSYRGGGVHVPDQAPMNLPLPAAYTAPIFVYGALALVPGRGQPVANLVGWGLVVATFLNLWTPANPLPAKFGGGATLPPKFPGGPPTGPGTVSRPSAAQP